MKGLSKKLCQGFIRHRNEKNPPDFRRKGTKCEAEINIMNEGTKKGFDALPKGFTGAYHEKHGS
ncbi:hypothetical protein GsuE55_28310 [Geobacillus subterraneus]|uniref:Uncharacterized protein n=1 Tax=Geobacillus subterraneus TaxID=129338 RepID=A0A679FNG0_9BACL|nr:hypothetical protein B4113_2592 [Geobacillus sp. B4113_201601]BBW97998.1 hypothetical protein GsuE55_28310 [Geobacillus subterraneus]